MSALPERHDDDAEVPGPHPVLVPVGQDSLLVKLDRPVILAGSGSTCRLNLKGSTVSTVHAAVVRDGSIAYVRDLASREGVKVDDEVIQECLLSGGEKVTIGGYDFLFEGVASRPMPPRAPEGMLGETVIESRTLLIGHWKTCDIVLRGDDSIATAHALILEIAGRRYIRDLGSKAGTRVNGRKVHFSVLNNGDVVQLGEKSLTYSEAEPLRFQDVPPMSETAMAKEPLKLSTQDAGLEGVASEIVPSNPVVEGLASDSIAGETIVESGQSAVAETSQVAETTQLKKDAGDDPVFSRASFSVPEEDVLHGVLGGIEYAQPKLPANSRHFIPQAPPMPAGQMPKATENDDFEALMASLDVPAAEEAASETVTTSGASGFSFDFDFSEAETKPAEQPEVRQLPASEAVPEVQEEAVNETATTGPITGPELRGSRSWSEVSQAAAVVPASPPTEIKPTTSAETEQASSNEARTPAEEGAELGRVLRSHELITEPIEDEVDSSGRSSAGKLVRWALVIAVAGGVGAGTWWALEPTKTVKGLLELGGRRVPDQASLLASDGLSEKVIAKLAVLSPGMNPGEIGDVDQLKQWLAAARMEGNNLTLEVVGTEAQAERLSALLEVVRDRASASSVDAGATTALAEALKNAEAALTTSQQKLSELETKAKQTEQVAAIASELAELQKRRDLIAGKIEAANSSKPAADEGARAKLDEAVASFRKQLDATKAQPEPDQRVAAFIAAVQDVQEQGARLTDEILARHTEHAERLQMLKRRLDERMRIRQQQAWENDTELKTLSEQLRVTKLKLANAEQADKTKLQDLQGEVEYLEGLISARRLLVGSDKGDQRALAEVQSIIEEQAKAAEEDRRRLSESFDRMRTTLAKAFPEAGSVPDAQRQLATDLEARLGELQSARAAWTDATATAISRHEQMIRSLESELTEVEQSMLSKGRQLDDARALLPSSQDLAAARNTVESANKAKDGAAKALAEAQSSPSNTPLPAPTVTVQANSGMNRPWYSLAAAVVAGLVLSPLTRSRRSEY